MRPKPMPGRDVNRDIRRIIYAIEGEMHRQGVNFTKLNERCGFSMNTANAVFRRHREPYLSTVLRMFEALDIDICLVNDKGDNILI